MKQLLFLFLLFSIPAWAASAPSTSKNYPVKVHVSSSLYYEEPWGKYGQAVLQLHVTIDGKKYVVEDIAGRSRLLALGDYPARLIKDVHPTPYKFSQTYKFLFPDGKTRKFVVVGQSE